MFQGHQYVRSGFGQFANVEFKGFGQFGYSNYDDYRAAILFYGIDGKRIARTENQKGARVNRT